MANTDGQIVLGLDIPKTVKQINADIKKLQDQLAQIKATGALDTSATVKQINAQITALQSQLKTININAKIDTTDAQKTGQKAGQAVADATQKAIDNKNINIDKLNADVKTLVNNLNSFSSKNAGFDSFKTEINGVEVSLDSLIGKLSTVDNVTDLGTILSQAVALKTAFTELAQINEIQLLSNGGIKNDYSTQIEVLTGKFRNLGLSEDEIQKKTSNVSNAFDTLKTRINQPFDESNYQEIISLNDKLQKELIESGNEYTKLQSSAKGFVSVQQRLSKANTIEAWNLKNKNATQEVRDANESYITSLRDLNTEMSKLEFNEISDGFSRTKNSMTALGKISTVVKGQLAQAATSLVSFISLSSIAMKAVAWLTKMPSTVTALDTALVDLRKTANMSTQELEDFYYASNDVAKQMGVTTEEILNQASAWSRFNKIDPLYGDI